MLDLRNQLRSYVEETIERVDIEDVVAVAPGRSLPEQSRPWFRRPAVVFMLTALAVFMAIGATTLLLRGSNPTPPTDSIPDRVPTTLEVTTTPPEVATTQETSTTPPTAPTTTTSVVTPTATTPSPTVIEGAGWDPAEAEAALAAIDSFYAALNSGELQTAMALVIDKTPAARLTEKLPVAVEGLHAQFTYDCTLGETAGVVDCQEYVSDDLYGPAGITNYGTVRYRYNEGNLIITARGGQPFVCQADPTGDASTFLVEFRVWAAETHPQLDRYWLWGYPIDSVLAIPCTVYSFRYPEDAIEIAKVVPEFVAESDHWPTDGTQLDEDTER